MWPIAGCPRVVFCCRPGLNNSHLPYALPLHSEVWHSPSDTNDAGVTSLSVAAVSSSHPRGRVTATNTEWGATGVCGRCSTTAYEAQRLWDTSACSATAALIMAETLTVCCLSMLGPHFHSRYLQYLKTTDIFLPGQEKGLVYFCSERGVGGWDRGLGECIIVPRTGLFFWHTYCRF